MRVWTAYTLCVGQAFDRSSISGHCGSATCWCRAFDTGLSRGWSSIICCVRWACGPCVGHAALACILRKGGRETCLCKPSRYVVSFSHLYRVIAGGCCMRLPGFATDSPCFAFASPWLGTLCTVYKKKGVRPKHPGDAPSFGEHFVNLHYFLQPRFSLSSCIV